MNLLKRITINTSVQIIGKGFSFVLSFISIYLLTRYLGVVGYGNFSLIFSYLSFFTILSDMGISLVVIREFARNQKKIPQQAFSSLINLKLILVIVSTILSIFLLLFFPYSVEIKKAIIIASFGLAIGSLNGFGNAILQAKLRLDLVMFIDQLIKLVTIIFIYIFISLKLNILYISSAISIGNLAGFFIILSIISKSISIKINFKNVIQKNIIKESVLIGITTLFAYTYFKVDLLILSLYRTQQELGIYSLAYKIIENILMMWGFYMATIYPLFSFYNNNLEIYKHKKILVYSIILSLIFASICILVGFTQSTMIIKLFGGNAFQLSIKPLKILLLSVPFFLINNIFLNSFLSRYKLKKVIISLFLAILINVGLNLKYIPAYGYFAAAYTTLITEISLFCFYFYFYLRRDNYE